MKALLIIDMQKISFTPATPRYNMEGVIERINTLSNIFRKKNLKVIFIQHDGSKENICIPGTEEWEILDSLIKEPSDLVISKTANDSFYRSDLKAELNKLGVNELVITGCATDFCVDATVKSALVNDFNITVISDGHTTADRPHLKAGKVIEHYNWMWNDLIPTKGKVQVMSSQEFLS